MIKNNVPAQANGLASSGHLPAGPIVPTATPTLARRIGLPLLTLYGLGVTIGAGIYVLVGTTAAVAGIYAPVSFVIAAAVVAFTAFSYAELGTRYPVSAGEAAYVRNGLRSNPLALVVGLLVAASGIVSSSAVSIGAAAYIGTFLDLPPALLTTAVIIVIGATAAWGILESVLLAAVFTLIEVIGLTIVIYQGLALNPDLLAAVPSLIPPFEAAPWRGIAAAGLLAFFAFVGFEDIANVAEEVHNPRHTMPRAIALTLVIATALYVVVVAIMVLAVPIADLAGAEAPLTLVFSPENAGLAAAFGAIAIIATINGVLVQMIMASRVLYGLAAQGSFPAFAATLAAVHPRTRTPVNATALVVVVILALALFFPIAQLAETTSTIVLVVFLFVNAALLRLKWTSRGPAPDEVFQVPFWVPIGGLITSAALLTAGLI